MNPRIGLILSIFFMFTLGLTAQVQASVGSTDGDFVIFRANISPLYIENESVIIQVLAIPFQGNKPTGESSTVHVQIAGINVKYNYSQQFTVHSGRAETLYLPALAEGHYDILLYAECRGIKSKVVDQDIGVTNAPVPYSLIITLDGSKIVFRSERLNETGYPDPKYPFTLQIYTYTHGSGESLVATYTNITNITIKVPDSWKTGILYVEVVDVFGWHNGMSIDLARMQFSGIPVSYDYLIQEREPYKSWAPAHIFLALIIFIVPFYLLVRWSIKGSDNKRRRGI